MVTKLLKTMRMMVCESVCFEGVQTDSLMVLIMKKGWNG